LMAATTGVIFLRLRSLAVPKSLREIHLYIYHYLTERPSKVNLNGRGGAGVRGRIGC
jgi:hypothetical protein